MRPQGLIGDIQLILKLLILPPQRNQLGASIFALAKRRDRLRHLVRVHLRKKVHAYHHDIAIEGCRDLLGKHNHQSGRIGTDFVFGHFHITDDGDAFQVDRDLFESVSFGGFGGEPDRIFSSISVSHSMFTLCIHDPDVSQRRSPE